MMMRIVLVLLGMLLAATAQAQDKPRYGGELIFLVPSELPSYDGHREGTFGVVHPLAPHYNTLLRIDPFDKTGTRPVPDLAESWTISPDGLIYTLKVRQGVRFHDGSVLTSRDVKATYDKIVFPPSGVISMRKGSYGAIETIEAPDPQTVRFRLKWPEASFLIAPVLALQLDLQGGHPGQGRALVRDQRDGHRSVQVRRAREGVALGGQEEPGLLGQGQAVPRRLPGPVHHLVVGPGGRHS